MSFSGLAPGFAGLYQLNVTIPSTISAGEQVIEIDGCEVGEQVTGAYCANSAGHVGVESSSAEALIPIGSTSAASSVGTQAAIARPRHGRSGTPQAVHKLRSSGPPQLIH